MDWPGTSESQREHCADGGRLHHWVECLIIVDSRALSEASENPTSLVPLKGTINPPLVCPDPLASDDVGAGWTRHQIPCLVGEESRVLLFHCMAPLRVRQGAANERGYRRDLRASEHCCESLGPRVLAACRVTIGWTCRGCR